MFDRLLSVIHSITNFVQTKTELALGGTSGSLMGFYLFDEGFVTTVLKFILAIIFSLCTGAAGTLGGILIKHFYKKWHERKEARKNVSPSSEGI
jgi:hypothetical protein